MEEVYEKGKVKPKRKIVIRSLIILLIVAQTILLTTTIFVNKDMYEQIDILTHNKNILEINNKNYMTIIQSNEKQLCSMLAKQITLSEEDVCTIYYTYGHDSNVIIDTDNPLILRVHEYDSDHTNHEDLFEDHLTNLRFYTMQSEGELIIFKEIELP